jgi:hypothetical protein
MTAKSLDSNLDLAYHLQMQEAMTASLSLQPSTSRRPSAAVTVILRELNDRMLREPKIGELREDLDRRIHHQKLANDIINIPDEEWENNIINISDEEGENDIVNIPDEEWEVTLHNNYRRPYESTDPETGEERRAPLEENQRRRPDFGGSGAAPTPESDKVLPLVEGLV